MAIAVSVNIDGSTAKKAINFEGNVVASAVVEVSLWT